MNSPSNNSIYERIDFADIHEAGEKWGLATACREIHSMIDWTQAGFTGLNQKQYGSQSPWAQACLAPDRVESARSRWLWSLLAAGQDVS